MQTGNRFAAEGETRWGGCERAQPGATRVPGDLESLVGTDTPTPGWDGACCLHPSRTPDQEAGAAALSRAWAPEGARGDLSRLHPRSWFKLVWAGCGPGQLHSRSQACCLPLGLPKSRAPGAGCWGMNSAPREAKRFLKIQPSV